MFYVWPNEYFVCKNFDECVTPAKVPTQEPQCSVSFGPDAAHALCRPNRGTIAGYFLADRLMWWLPVGASLFASNIGSEHFIGMASSGAASGIGIGAFNFNSIILLQLMSWVFLPVFIASKVRTVPEYMHKRFGGQRIQMYLAVLSLLLYIFTKISVDLYSGSIFINQALKWDIYWSMVGLLVLTALFTVTGGLAAVIYTDTLQVIIMLGGALFVMIKAFQEVGGYGALQYKYMQAVPKLTYENTSCGLPRDDSWIMLRDPVNSDLPWPAFLLGQTPASIWYWCADQMMIQRALAAKSLSHAKGATVFASYLKILPFFIIILPGMISRALFPDDVACVLPEECLRACGSRSSCYNSAYPRLVVGIMPAGFKGLMLAVMLAALLSDLTSIFNSASTMFTLDLWRHLRPRAQTRELLIVGKLFVVVLIALSVAWVPIIEKVQGGQLFIYIQKVGAYLAPPIAAVYLMAVLWKRMNEKGAFWALTVGLLVGVIRMALDFSHPPPACNQHEYRPLLIRFNFMYFAMILFWITCLTGVLVSLLTKPSESFRVIRTTYSTRFNKKEREDEKAVEIALHSLTPETNPAAPSAEIKTETQFVYWLRKGKTSCMWLCGLDLSQQSTRSMEEEHQEVMNSLEENPRVKIILNVNFGILVAVGIGLFTYFTTNPFPADIDPRTYSVM
ncbi:sodium/glucose cotransporter 5-like [Eriocheir sinensis]|uniref:sodium/glucose cotransporter 5-like n=1 Tax=Eriocheir sinensis TaxID=95602 RepID=UPI0021CA81B7|nr:sodium/glucose cotransporter 5-like [Eriocheir sinensis]